MLSRHQICSVAPVEGSQIVQQGRVATTEKSPNISGFGAYTGTIALLNLHTSHIHNLRFEALQQVFSSFLFYSSIAKAFPSRDNYQSTVTSDCTSTVSPVWTTIVNVPSIGRGVETT